ncbi:MAG TPA: DUF1272 domain-containing protein [Pedobacter sp.]
MLELRPVCENCNKTLPNESVEAMICTFECTFCSDCVNNILSNVCPNCGGGFEKRPIRPKDKLIKYPQQTQEYHQPVDVGKFQELLTINRNVDPSER